MILFGGATDICCSPTKGDTWQFSSGKWTQLAPKASPKPRIGHAAVYDSKRGRPVFFGGAPGHNSTPFNDTWIVAGSPRATFDTFGKGCASTTPKFPTVSSAAGPKLGSQFTLDLKGFLPKPRGGYLILGISDKTWGIIPLPLSLAFIQAPNCSLFVSLDSSNFFVTNSSGAFSAKFTIPSSPTLIGTTFFGQAWAGDPFANQLGLATTNAFKAVVGW